MLQRFAAWVAMCCSVVTFTHADKEDFVHSDVYDVLLPEDVPRYAPLPESIKQRSSCDVKCNQFGHKLLKLCQDANLLILNGRISGDECGKLTCHTGAGHSVVDYFIASPQMLDHVVSLHVQDLMPESDHCPLTLVIDRGVAGLPAPTPQISPSTLLEGGSEGSRGASAAPQLSQPVKIRHHESKTDQYRYALSLSLPSHFDVDTSESAHPCYATALQECIIAAATSTFGHCKPASNKHRHQHKPWYDDECKALRKEVSSYQIADPQRALLSKQYTQLVKKKRRQAEHAAHEELCMLAIKDSSQFWRRFKQRAAVHGDIGADQWKEAFEMLVGRGPDDTSQIPSAPPCSPASQPDEQDACLNAPITEEDVQAAFKRLKCHKAAGVDGIKPEHLLDAEDLLLQPLTCAFNQMLEHGVPESWCMGVIHPIFKAGDANDPSNYRGITVTAVLAKLFAMVLEERLSAWAEAKQLRAAGQAGFRKDHRTVDNLFIMNALVGQAKSQRGKKLYCCFVDFRKAFDSIPRERMWQVLHERGLTGQAISALKSTYEKDKACVLTQEGLTESFPCSIGVKQGCPASPLLFGLYIDDLEKLLLEASQGSDIPPHSQATAQGEGGQGTCHSLNPPDSPSLLETLIPLLLFADDLAIFSYSPSGLQAQLRILEQFCRDRGLVVNVAKTKVIVFQHRKTACPAFYFGGEEIARVDAFKYLGIVFHGTRGLSCAIEQLAVAARKALFAMLGRCRQLRIHKPDMKCKLFDCLVRPILSYACELWSVIVGSKTAMKQLEQVHIGFLRRLLGVPVSTTKKLIYAEFGRLPLKHFWWAQSARYAQRMHELDESRLCKVAFVAECRRGGAWITGFQQRCEKMGTCPPTVDEAFDAHAAIAASKDMYIQWMMQPDEGSRRQLTYFSFKTQFRTEPYISEAKNAHLRRVLACFRTGSHWLQVQTGRFSNIDFQHRHCPTCSDVVEDEHHALFVCPDYDHLRSKCADLFSTTTDLRSFLTQNAVHKFALTECRALRNGNN